MSNTFQVIESWKGDVGIHKCLSLRQLARTSARTMDLELGQVIKARSFFVTGSV